MRVTLTLNQYVSLIKALFALHFFVTLEFSIPHVNTDSLPDILRSKRVSRCRVEYDIST